ncbi:Pre-mRNA-processing protein prp40 [Fusarium oxysporum f. sp. albedinis]|nr:Pre-mRNA-processing protein prp40 [Fusarium oxysporum f. sp. albedinis]
MNCISHPQPHGFHHPTSRSAYPPGHSDVMGWPRLFIHQPLSLSTTIVASAYIHTHSLSVTLGRKSPVG